MDTLSEHWQASRSTDGGGGPDVGCRPLAFRSMILVQLLNKALPDVAIDELIAAAQCSHPAMREEIAEFFLQRALLGVTVHEITDKLCARTS